MIISRTPFRVSFFGGGTDFPEFYREHGGACLATTINKFSYISIHTLAPFFKYKFHASYAKTELVERPEEFQHPLIRECLLLLDVRDSAQEDAGIVRFKHWGVIQTEKVVFEGEREVLIKRRSHWADR